MKGYWNHADEDAKVFVDGRVRTGDVGVLDADGYLKIVDRLKDMISVGAFTVFPSQIEAVLYRHPDVREALAIGIPAPSMRERPRSFVTLNAGATIPGAALSHWLTPPLATHARVASRSLRQGHSHAATGGYRIGEYGSISEV